MQIKDATLLLKKNGLSLEQLYREISPQFSVLHNQACSHFLGYGISYHEFYCDMKRLEQLEKDEVAFGLYESTRSGFSTQIVFNENEFNETVKLIKRGILDTVLLFHLTHHAGNLLFPAGKVYKVISG